MADVISTDDRLVAGKSTAFHARVAVERSEGQAGLQVPDLQRFVLGRGNGPLAVRRHRHAIDRIRVAFQGAEGAAGLQDALVPQLSLVCVVVIRAIIGIV